MHPGITSFELSYRGSQVTVAKHAVAGTYIYRITFTGNTPALVITRASNAENEAWWTSVPEGRLAEAREIGKLIEEYFRLNP